MLVQATWFETNWGAGKYVKEGEPITLHARETPKLMFVTMPNGAVERVRKFDKSGNARRREAYHMSLGGKVVLTWNPADYEKR